ncbi:MAG: hypothetical protein SPJ32_00900 [Oscillospiraceae bacterium]|nr:hypothetical protein [Oscillospiraceae bacterium]
MDAKFLTDKNSIPRLRRKTVRRGFFARVEGKNAAKMQIGSFEYGKNAKIGGLLCKIDT